MNKYVKGVSTSPASEYVLPSIDIIEPEYEVGIEVQRRESGSVLYVHVNGQTVLRICRIKLLKLEK